MPGPFLINGNYYSFADIELSVGGLLYAGVKSVNYSDSEGMTYVFGTARNPLGLTAGNLEPKAEIEMYLPAWNVFLATAQADDPLLIGWRRYPITITVTYSSAMGLPIVSDIIIGAFVADVDASQSQGDDPLVRKLGLKPQAIWWGGLPSIIELNVAFAVA